ncbi:hypothetical protein LTR56_014697 [Elasticomyces elasticus]|nr:hypothetical protein LTR22_024252 [Elasticomyces elasticus]KAK3635530.1 hypothetical protein LTR56_014697 [Elasticomyces elasticus]KAK4904830.1 hypothetical protein LTR49_025781 [Elasticomyces elasticus]KAK5744095.1 hypothetical protein LTS12_023596 [Elasticomyces elasticus]
MRLLNVQTLNFTEFSSDVPKYVIASHRWTAGSEAKTKDVEKRRNTHSSGYKKVEGFAKYARDCIADVEWFWIDTCCVNQESSQEVNEAVNSMFSWYANAEMCLVYLADVDKPLHEDECLPRLQASEWFTRGWTLQELLAPHMVTFLSKRWEVIGNKSSAGSIRRTSRINQGPSLIPLLATITSIPEKVLYNYEQSKTLTTEDKLAWIVGRNTAKCEDMYYSLLGKFGVRMRLDYGQGAESARQRLLKKIDKASQQPTSHPQ